MVLVLETQATMQRSIADHVRDMDGFRRDMGDICVRLDRIEIILSHHGQMLERHGQLLERHERILENLPQRVKQAIGFGRTP